MAEVTIAKAKGLKRELEHSKSENNQLFKGETTLYEQFNTLKRRGDKQLSLVTNPKF